MPRKTSHKKPSVLQIAHKQESTSCTFVSYNRENFNPFLQRPGCWKLSYPFLGCKFSPASLSWSLHTADFLSPGHTTNFCNDKLLNLKTREFRAQKLVCVAEREKFEVRFEFKTIFWHTGNMAIRWRCAPTMSFSPSQLQADFIATMSMATCAPIIVRHTCHHVLCRSWQG